MGTVGMGWGDHWGQQGRVGDLRTQRGRVWGTLGTEGWVWGWDLWAEQGWVGDGIFGDSEDGFGAGGSLDRVGMWWGEDGLGDLWAWLG